MAPIKSTQSRTGGKLLRGGRSSDVTSTTEISGRREDNLGTLLTVSGGTKIESGNDRYHVFTSPGTFTTGAQLTAEVLVIAGGGGGAGAAYGGGGGAGGVLHAPSTSIKKGRYSVTVSGQTYHGGWHSDGGDGDDSSFGDAIAKGGGAGCGYLNGPADRRGPLAGTITTRGRSGGSSGGSGPQTGGTGSAEVSDAVLPNPAPSDYTPYGNLGGAGGEGGHPTPGAWYQSGGGGGSGGVGSNATEPGVGVAGGPGRAFPSFPAPVIAPGIPAPVRPGWTPVVGPTGLFAGGGSSSTYYTSGAAAGATPGGGGAGAGPTTAPGGDGVRFTGSGGGGGNYPQYPLTGYGGKGADGIVIVKYSVA